MGIERVNSVFDIPSIQKEYDAFVAGLSDSQKAVVQLFTTIQGYKGTTLATIGKETDKLAASTAKVVKVTEQMNDAVTKAERAKAAALKTDQQVLKVMQEEEKVLQQTTRTKQATTKLEETMLRQKQRLAKEMEKESAAAKQTANAYDILKARYNQAANESKALAAQLWATAKGDKAVYDQLVKDNKAYQDVTAAAQKYYGQLDQLETSIGQYQRRVGQYERSNYALSNSFSQLTREAPAFANSVQTGLMGLSNNIPIFADAIASARKEGQSFGQILKSLAGSLFSFGGIVTILTTVLTFLPMILKAASGESKKMAAATDDIDIAAGNTSVSVKTLTENQEKLAAELAESTKEAVASSVKLKAYADIAADGTKSIQQRNNALAEANEILGDNSKQLTLNNVKTEEGTKIIEAYTRARIQQAIADAAATKVADLYIKEAEAKRELEKAIVNEGKTKAATAKLNRTVAEQERAVNEYQVTAYQAATKKRIEADTNLKTVTQDRIDTENLLSNAIDQVTLNTIEKTKKDKDGEKAAKDAAEAAERQRKAEFDLYKFRTETQISFNKSIVENDTLNMEVRTSSLLRMAELEKQLAERTAKFEIETAGTTATERKLIEEEKGAELRRIAEQTAKYSYDIFKDAESKIQRDLTIVPEIKDDAEQMLKEYKEMMAAAIKFSKDATDKIAADQKKQFEALQDRAQKFQATSQNYMSAFGELFSIGIDTQKVKLQELEAEQQKAYENEVKRITSSSLTEQEKADKLKILESERQAQKEANDRRTKKLEVDRARFQKAQDIANIISGTAVAVINALGAKPWTPLNIALAASIGALGAAQLAKAIAVPLPKYAEGTDSSKGGWALTDEKGPELYIEPGGSTYFGNEKPTLRNLRPGTKIIPSDEVNQFLQRAMMAETAKQLQMTSAYTNDDRSHELSEIKEAIVAQTDATIREMRRQKKQINIKNNIDLGWGSYVKDKTFN